MPEPKFLLDSDVCIYLLEGDALELRQRVEQHAPGELVVSVITYAEVLVGAARNDAVLEATRFFTAFPVMAFDEQAALSYARLPFRRAKFDHLIAAHALALGLPLVTNNGADFTDIPGLTVENWTR